MKVQKILSGFCVLIFAFFMFLTVACFAGKPEKQPDDSGVKVTFFDVGKGDAILVETAHHAVLIDSGYDDTKEIILDYMEKQEISSLDYLVITHFDKDHVGGADWILRRVETRSVLQPDYESDSAQYREYVEAAREREVPVISVTNTMELSLDGVDFLVYPPQKKSYEEDNDFSLVIRMDVAVITSSKEKPADDEICRMLERLGTEVYFTENGTVTCLCDGKGLRVVQG